MQALPSSKSDLENIIADSSVLSRQHRGSVLLAAANKPPPSSAKGSQQQAKGAKGAKPPPPPTPAPKWEQKEVVELLELEADGFPDADDVDEGEDGEFTDEDEAEDVVTALGLGEDDEAPGISTGGISWGEAGLKATQKVREEGGRA